jgi:hypothetical protein
MGEGELHRSQQCRQTLERIRSSSPEIHINPTTEMNTPTLTGAYTCTHHNDQQRSACPVCLVTALTAELEDPQKLHAHCLRTLNEGQIAHLFGERMTEIVNRAEKTEAAQTVALANWNGALERALKAEADLAALEQCHDDNCRAVVKFAADLTTERERVRILREALENLRDEQNGAPLCTREEQWTQAMDRADAALAATEDAK